MTTLNTPLLQYEQKLWETGVEHIAGVDEVGRGSLAGPLVAAAVILNPTHLKKVGLTPRNNDVEGEILKVYAEIKDSKLLTANRREKLSVFILEKALSYQIELLDAGKVDDFGISKATQIIFFNSVNRLRTKPQHILIDNFQLKNVHLSRQTHIPKGDNKSISIAAASIIAKVYRDRLMVKFHEEYPEYNFHRHKGYGTALHLEKLAQHGPCEIHRKSFKPVGKANSR